MANQKETESNTDARGNAIDPTENVRALSDASNRRQDDLREAHGRFVEAKFEAMNAKLDALKELVIAEARRLNEQSKMYADNAEHLATAEAKRIDAIRAVDVAAVAVASQRSSDQATVLANQVSSSAEALRGLVASTAATVASAQQQLSNTLSERIASLEKGSYQDIGKRTMTDPQIAQMLMQMQEMQGRMASMAGGKAGTDTAKDDSFKWMSALLGIAVLVLAAMTFFRTPAATPVAPVVIPMATPTK